MAITFQKAVKSQKKLRLAFDGPSGSGKTMSALRVARGLVGAKGRIVVIDTERSSASLYANDIEGGFDTFCMEGEFRPRNYVEAIEAANEAGYDVIVIDSLSHAWNSTGGALDLVDRKTAASRSKNSYNEGWREVTPEHNAMINAILQSKAHVMVTMRTKVEYVLEEDERGKKVPRKVGMAPVQREGLEFEFDCVLDLDQSHRAIPSKTRAKFLDGQVVALVTEKLGEQFRAWLDAGAPEAPRAAPAVHPAVAANAQPAAPAPEATPAPAVAAAAAAPVQTTTPSAAAATSTAPAATGPTTPAERAAVALHRQLAEAQSIAQLDALVSVISAAIKAGHVNQEERVALLARYGARNAEIKARPAQGAAA